jgi:hypothetical protein
MLAECVDLLDLPVYSDTSVPPCLTLVNVLQGAIMSRVSCMYVRWLVLVCGITLVVLCVLFINYFIFCFIAPRGCFLT